MKKDQTLQVRTGGETGLMNNGKELERMVCREVTEWDISRKISVTWGLAYILLAPSFIPPIDSVVLTPPVFQPLC